MKPTTDVSKIFNKFAGREILMIETEHKMTVSGKEYKTNEARPANQNDPLLRDMRDEAKKHGLTLRLWWEGAIGTMDLRSDRVNAHIEKGSDGKWRIGQRFNLG